VATSSALPLLLKQVSKTVDNLAPAFLDQCRMYLIFRKSAANHNCFRPTGNAFELEVNKKRILLFKNQ